MDARRLAVELQLSAKRGTVSGEQVNAVVDALLEMTDKLERLEAENAGLQELVSILSVINKNMSQCSVTDCNQCPVSNECSESVHLEGLLGIDTKEISWRVQWRNEDSFDIQGEVDKR